MTTTQKPDTRPYITYSSDGREMVVVPQTSHRTKAITGGVTSVLVVGFGTFTKTEDWNDVTGI